MHRLSSLALALAAVVATWALAAAPAPACGCGILAPSEGSDTSVDGERSLVVFDGARETIVMRLGVRGDTRSMAWLMPLPGPATVRLGDNDVFDELDRLAEPRVKEKKRYKLVDLGGGGEGSGGPRVGDTTTGAGGVQVVTSQRLGPLQVVTLRATDPRALDTWLKDNGYTVPPGFAGQSAYYLSRGWLFMAAKLQSMQPAEGSLQPLVMSFASKRPLYPLRLSRLASSEQQVEVDVAAPWRVEWSGLGGAAREPAEGDLLSSDGPVSVLVAESLSGRPMAEAPRLQRLLAGNRRFFLTSFQGRFAPGEFTSDPVLTRSGDAEFHRTVYHYKDVYLVNEYGPWLCVAFVVIVMGTGALLFVVLRRRRRAAEPSRRA